MDIVVGSGPAGVACASALLSRGRKVRMLDAGLTLEPEHQSFVQRLKQLPVEQWEAPDLSRYRASMKPGTSGVPVKLAYGSDFAYRGADESLGLDYTQVGLRPSLARGGLSNVWGAAMMSFAQRDIDDWPFTVEALATHYSAVLDLTGMAAGHDLLEPFFPLHTNNLTQLRPSRQAASILETMQRHQSALRRAGIHFGRSRLAVQGSHERVGGGCSHCRLCMYGCPYGFIYNSEDTLKQLQGQPGFSYESGIIVMSVAETADGVRVSGRKLAGHPVLNWDCERIFLAAGVIPTTQILLRSLGAYDQTVWIRDSQYFLLPLAMLRRLPGSRADELHALSQIFLEIFDEHSAQRTVHLQLYSNNDMINETVENAFGPFCRPLAPLVRSLQDRLLVGQGFLHSDFSSRIAVQLKSDKNGGERMAVHGEPNPAAKSKIRQIVYKLLKHARRLGAVALIPMLKRAEPGRSFHCGGTFPMALNPQGFQTDVLGRVPGWKRVHAVDATVFPSIPATTITLSAMANAHRIGSQAESGEIAA